jgi:hypothetical protein
MNVVKDQENKSLETQLIIACARTCVPEVESEQITALLARQLDWDYILSIAGRNMLLPLLSWTLLKNFSASIPVEAKDGLQLFLKKHTQKNLLLTSKLIEVIGILEKNQISVLPFKGVTLAVKAYNNVSLRHFCDLDLLVKPKHFDQAVKILSENGYVPNSQTNWWKRKLLFFTHKKDIIINSSDNFVQIELHWKLSGSHFSMPVEISQLWKRLEKLDLGGIKVNTLPFKDLFVYLCLHGSRHEWERLSWICDLRELILNYKNLRGEIDWSDLREHAKNHGLERVVELGLFLVQYFYGLRTEYPNYSKIETDIDFQKIAAQVKEKIFSLIVTPSPKADKYMYLLSLQEKRTHRIKLYLVYLTFYLRLILTPNSLDISIFHLPTIFYPLYFILRPIRLFFTYFHRPANQKK